MSPSKHLKWSCANYSKIQVRFAIWMWRSNYRPSSWCQDRLAWVRKTSALGCLRLWRKTGLVNDATISFSIWLLTQKHPSAFPGGSTKSDSNFFAKIWRPNPISRQAKSSNFTKPENFFASSAIFWWFRIYNSLAWSLFRISLEQFMISKTYRASLVTMASFKKKFELKSIHSGRKVQIKCEK